MTSASYTSPSATTARPTGQPYFLPQTAIQVDLTIQPKKASVAACEATAATEARKVCTGRWKDKPSEIEPCQRQEQPALLEGCLGQIPDTPANYDVRLTLEARRIPDPSRLYVLKHNRNWLSDDDLKVEIDAAGFLQSVSGQTVDRTPDVLEKIVTVATNLGKLKTAPPGVARAPAPPSECSIGARAGSYRWVKTLREVKGTPPPASPWTVSFDVGRCAHALELIVAELGVHRTGDPPNLNDGILVTVAQPYRIEAQLELDEVTTRAQLYAALPDQAPTFLLPVRRTWFATVDHDIKISQGMLSSVRIDRPSPFVGFLETPVRVTERLIKLPVELIQFKYDGPTQAAQLEQKLLAAQLELERTRKELEAARAPAAVQSPD